MALCASIAVEARNAPSVTRNNAASFMERAIRIAGSGPHCDQRIERSDGRGEIPIGRADLFRVTEVAIVVELVRGHDDLLHVRFDCLLCGCSVLPGFDLQG